MLISFFESVSQIGKLISADLIMLTLTSSPKYCIKFYTASSPSCMVCLDKIRLFLFMYRHILCKCSIYLYNSVLMHLSRSPWCYFSIFIEGVYDTVIYSMFYDTVIYSCLCTVECIMPRSLGWNQSEKLNANAFWSNVVSMEQYLSSSHWWQARILIK